MSTRVGLRGRESIENRFSSQTKLPSPSCTCRPKAVSAVICTMDHVAVYTGGGCTPNSSGTPPSCCWRASGDRDRRALPVCSGLRPTVSGLTTRIDGLGGLPRICLDPADPLKEPPPPASSAPPAAAEKSIIVSKQFIIVSTNSSLLVQNSSFLVPKFIIFSTKFIIFSVRSPAGGLRPSAAAWTFALKSKLWIQISSI